MNKITQFNKENLKSMRDEINANLKELGESYGISFKVGNISYSETEFKASLKCTIALNETELADKEKNDFTANCLFFGLSPEDYGKEFVNSGKTFQIKGLKFNSRKYPILAKCLADGKTYKFAEDSIKKLINK